MEKHALLIANSASMIDHFNKDNIRILQDMGYTISVAANFQEGNSSTVERIHAFASELAAQDIEIIDLPIPRKITELGKAFKSIRILKRYMRNHPCQIVHTQTPFGGVVGRLAAKKFRKDGTKVIYFVHGFHFFRGAGIKNYLLYYNVEKWLSHVTDCLITLNQEDYQAAKRRFHHPNVHYVPGVGVDTDTIASICVDKADVCRRFGLPSDKKIILTVAELIPRKNVETSIRAFAKSNRDDAILAICGKGVLEPSLKELAQKLYFSRAIIRMCWICITARICFYLQAFRRDYPSLSCRRWLPDFQSSLRISAETAICLPQSHIQAASITCFQRRTQTHMQQKSIKFSMIRHLHRHLVRKTTRTAKNILILHLCTTL